MLDKKFQRGFLVVPKLIEQSTWGGDYILEYKNWSKKENFKNIKIGQSYELFSGSKLRIDLDSSEDSSFTGELGYAMEPDKTYYNGDRKKLLSLDGLIKKSPKEVLGEKGLKNHGGKIKILNKFTQAKGNSFQIHVQEKDQCLRWQAKPESWYYFEPGLLTLGCKENISWKDYQNSCLDLDGELTKISQKMIKREITLDEAKKESRLLIKKYNPAKFVNLVRAKKDMLIDLSCGGLHHSWEEDPKKCPLGNIVYELCFDVMDPKSVLRAYDKGKIKEDGSLRKLNIESYFKFIDKSKIINNPENHIKKSSIIYKDNNCKVEKLLRTKYYCFDKIEIKSDYTLENIKLDGSYQHLFAQEGKFLINTPYHTLTLTKGHSCFLPACLENYSIKNTEKETGELLKTFVS